MTGIIKKFVSDVKYTIGVFRGRSEKNITAVRDSVTKRPERSIRHLARKLGISTETFQLIITEDL